MASKISDVGRVPAFTNYNLGWRKPAGPAPMRLAQATPGEPKGNAAVNPKPVVLTEPCILRPLAAPAREERKPEISGLATNRPLSGVISFEIEPHARQTVSQVSLLVDGTKVATASDDSGPIGRVQAQLSTPLFTPGEHKLQVQVLERPTTPGAEGYQVRLGDALPVVFTNRLWMSDWTGVVEAQLVVHFGTSLNGTYRVTLKDPRGRTVLEKLGNTATDRVAGNISISDAAGRRYPEASYLEGEIVVTPANGSASEEIKFRLKVQQR